MTISVVSFIILVCSVLTGLITEAIKKMVDVNKPNIVAAIVSVIVGAVISTSYIAFANLPYNFSSICFIGSTIVLSWLSAMLGYDKVIQTISQLRR